MLSKTGIMLFLSTAILTGCKSTQPHSPASAKPQWITNTPSSPYMVYSVGSAKNTGDIQQAKLAAQEAARLELAKQLNVFISGSTSVQQTATEKSMQFHVDELINSTVPTIQLQGVKIEQEYQEAEIAYALASFNRTEAIMHTELSINSLDENINAIKLHSSNKAQLLNKAIEVKKLTTQRKKLNDYLQLLQSSPVSVPDTVNTQLDKSKLILDSLSFNVIADNLDHAKVHDLISSALTNNGIKITPKDADFDLSFRIEWQERYKAGTYYSIAESYMVVSENGEEKAHFNSRVKGASSYQDTAKSNAMKKLADQLSLQLAKFIVSGQS